MAPYIFRKYTGYNPNEIKCWSPSSVIDTNSFNIEDIVATRGASKAGTSIPSPLGRLELFDTAFHIVATDQRNNLVGKTIYHQLVSDCLDVMQLMFNTKNSEIGIGNRIWFKEWKIRDNIDKLKSKGEAHPHYLLGKSYEQIFFDRINNSYTNTESIFLIYYENKLLGGTSPLTLFFTTPNWARYISDGLIANIPRSIDGDVFFDDDYRALIDREESFVKYVYKLFLQNRQAFNNCDGLRKYINKSIDTRYPQWRNQFPEYNNVNFAEDETSLMDRDYNKIKTNIDGKYLTVNGIYFYNEQQGRVTNTIQNNSDFIIRASETKYARQFDDKGTLVDINQPLVLLDGMNLPGDYMDRNAPWDSNTRVKDFYHRAIPLYERKLPQGNSLTVTYPFVTTDDFLEDILIEMPYKINSSKFYTGFRGDFKYLLPIKKEYFNFFKKEDLDNNLLIEIDETKVTVTLKIPIKNKRGIREIPFVKTYDKSKGKVIECKAGLGIYPFYQVTDAEINSYTILLAERFGQIRFESLSFFSFKNPSFPENSLAHKRIDRSTPSDIESGDSLTTSKFFLVDKAFDFIELAYTGDNENKLSGLIIPNFINRKFNNENLVKAFTFAIDFGTSNTHVAYMENGGAIPKPFTIEESDQQMVLLNAPGTENDLSKYSNYGQFPFIGSTIKREFIPALISNSDSTISFPFKTASSEIAAFSNIEKSNVHLFSHINIGYYIDQEEKKADGSIPTNIIYTTNLKWLLENNNDDTNKSRVKFFLKQLLIQIKAKCVINSGKLSQLNLVWSVPLSMERGNRTTLKNILQEAFNEVFINSGAKIISQPIPESIAPYFFLTRSEDGIKDTANVINVDIGGGTTDVMMFMESTGNRSDKYLTTSFRFAGGDIWGSGFKSRLKDNGFIKNYFKYQKANSISPKENEYLNKIKDDGNLSSDDLISMLFKYNDKFRFTDSITIGNPKMALILYLHYSAIVYHIVQILEIKKYPLPRYLSFTGKGSQYIKLICGGDEAELIAFTKLLFKAYTKLDVQKAFTINLNKNPKEITANGAVLYSLSSDDEKAKYESVKEFVHPGFNPSNDQELLNTLLKAENQEFFVSNTLSIDSPLNIGVLNNLNIFLQKTLSDRAIIDFLSDFKIKNVKPALSSLLWNGDIFNGEGHIYDSYRKVLNELHKQDPENQLPETLFFFALKDALYCLSKEIMDTNTTA